MKKIKKITIAILMMTLFLCVSACGGEVTEEDNPINVTIILKQEGVEFWPIVQKGAEDAAAELGVDLNVQYTKNELQIDKQIEIMNNAIEADNTAIVLAPLDTEALNESVEKAADKGIYVFTLDSDITSERRVASVGTDNEAAGAIAARKLVDNIGTKGEVAIIAHVEGSQTADLRIKGFKDTIEKNYKGIKISGVSYCKNDRETAKKLALDYIRNNDKLSAIYATNENSALGVGDAIKEAKMKDRIYVIGFDSSDDQINMLIRGAIDGIVVQNPYNMGYLSVRYAVKKAMGKTVKKHLDTGATFVDRSNIYDDDVRWLLYPLGREASGDE